MPAESAKLGEQLRKFFASATLYTAYEAGFSGFGLHRELVRQGIANRVVHAAAVEVAAHNRVKPTSEMPSSYQNSSKQAAYGGYEFPARRKNSGDC